MPSGKRGVAVSTLGNFAPPAVGLATAPMLASALGPASRGQLAVATTVLVLAVSIGALGLPQALIYYTARKGTNHRKLFTKCAALLGLVGLLISACIFSLAEVLSEGDARLTKLIGYASLALSPSLILASLRAVASGVQAWKLVASERILSSTIRLLAISGAYLMGILTLEVATLIIAISSFVGLIAYISLPKLTRNYESKKKVDPTWREIMPFSATFWVGVVTGALMARLDQVLLLPLAGAEELGIYAVSVSIGEMALLFNYAVNAVINAREAHNPNVYVLAMAARISSFVTSMGCLGLALACIWAVPALFGEQFSSVVPVVWILLAGIALSNSGTVVGSGLNGRGRPGLRSISMSIALLINIVTLLILSPPLGAMGAAIATTIGTTAYGLINLLVFRRLYGTNVRTFLGIRKGDLLFLLQTMPMRKYKKKCDPSSSPVKRSKV